MRLRRGRGGRSQLPDPDLQDSRKVRHLLSSRAAHATVEPCAVNRTYPCRCVRKENEYRNLVRAYPIERLRAYRYQQVLLERRVCLWKVLRPHDRPRFVYLRCALWTAHLHLHLHLACGCNFGKRPPGPASPFHEPGTADRGGAPAQPIEPGLTAEPGHRIHFQRACQCVPRPCRRRGHGQVSKLDTLDAPPPRRSTANDSSAGLAARRFVRSPNSLFSSCSSVFFFLLQHGSHSGLCCVLFPRAPSVLYFVHGLLLPADRSRVD